MLVVAALVACGSHGASTPSATSAPAHVAPPATAAAAPPLGPTIAITVVWDGASSNDVEATVTNPIEDAVARVPGVKQSRSVSRDGRAEIAVDFAAQAEPLAAAEGVQARVTSVLARLPSGVAPPIVAIATRRDAVVARFVATSDTWPAGQVGDFVRRGVKTLEQIGGVASVELCGVAPARIDVVVDPMRVGSMGVTVGEVAAALRALAPAGPVDSAEPLMPIIVAMRNGAPVRIRDVAQVMDDYAPAACLAATTTRMAGVTGAVYAQAGADLAQVRTRVDGARLAFAQAMPAGLAVEWLPAEAPVTLRAVVPADASAPALADMRRSLRDAAVAAGATSVIVSRGEPSDELAPSAGDLVVRAWPAGAELEHALRSKLAMVQGARLDGTPPHVIGVTGADLVTLDHLANDISTQLEAMATLASLGTVDAPVPRLDIRINRERAVASGVSLDDLAEVVHVANAGEDIAGLATGSPDMAVHLRYGVDTTSPQWLQDASVTSARGGRLSVSQLVRVVATSSRPIRHVDGQRWVGVRVVTNGNDAGLAALVAKLQLPAGYRAAVE